MNEPAAQCRTPPTFAARASTFEEGATLGKAVLFEEPFDVMRMRQYRPFGGLVFVILISGVMVPLALFVPDGPSLFTPIWILLGLLFVGVMVDLKAKLPAYGRVTPFRIYEKGISMGYGRHPYRPIEAIYSIEETVSAKHRAPFAVVAFSDGTESGISKRGLGRPMIVLTDDFERTTEMLRGLLAGASLPRLPWDSEAIAFVEGLHALRGATRARIENVAREKDVDRVTLAFIAANWREIGDSDGVRWRQFRKVARNEFGDTSVKMSPIPRGH